ncbi:hypothetical protein [Nonomuraea lactucae]|uniref:hypothetical protein n=1 Tax=Nonomuraea lactucae TaxID=2249762 RepID=UPI000DE1FDCE|nr:hypothetical protein [Nonomuraea lactucae]
MNLNNVTLITDDYGNILGGSFGGQSELGNGDEGKATLVALEGQRLWKDVSLTSELRRQEDDEALLKELLAHRVNEEGKLVRKS